MKTNNPGHGFYGTIKRANVDACWAATMDWLQTTYQLDPIDARNYLDSGYGRHLADMMADCTRGEIEQKSDRYMRHSIKDVVRNRAAFE